MQIKVADWIKGQTCGLCGKADGEIRQEYRTSNGRVTKNAVSFAHSWVLPAENCRDTTEAEEFNSFLYCLDLLVCADAAVIPQDFYNYSVDMRETTQAHLACSCTPQCA
uniref:VWFD domain-containing protein n=1 Tax=Hippocampus comes TaxID=109280 RepID=A0A3Q3DKM8_HIPCM